jgi:hypothetical protein
VSFPVEQPRPLPVETAEPRHTPVRWYHVLGSALFSIFCMSLGMVLMYLPWDDSWPVNYFASFGFETLRGAEFALWWRETWMNPYFRGAISGLGAVNLYIGIREVGRMGHLFREAAE